MAAANGDSEGAPMAGDGGRGGERSVDTAAADPDKARRLSAPEFVPPAYVARRLCLD